MKHVGRPVPNAALLGGFAAVTGPDHAGVGRLRHPAKVSGRGGREERRGRQRKPSSSRIKAKDTIDA
jgi:hypothetical protein